MSARELDEGRTNESLALRLGTTHIVGEFLTDFAKMCHPVAGQGGSNELVDIKKSGWTLGWLFLDEPTISVQIRTIDSSRQRAQGIVLHDIFRDALQGLGFEVRDNGDHLVVELEL